MVKVRQLAADEHYSLRGKTLEECIQADKQKGLIPFFVRHFFCCLLIIGSFVVVGMWNIRNNIMLFI
jgi:hypothetical protein